ncbi:MAG: PKD domain-containing protein, partial [Bacteroidota bacterium]
MSLKYWFLIFFLFADLELFGQCLNLDFDVKTNVCTDEIFQVLNTSTEGSNYAWDFCPDDLSSVPEVIDLESTTASGVLDSKLIYDGVDYYVFIVSRNTTKLFRAYFGPDLNSLPTISEVNVVDNSNGAYDRLWALDITQNGDGNWVGIVTNANGSRLVLLDFGNSLSNDIVATEINKPTGVSIAGPTDVDIVEEGGNYYAFISNISVPRVAQLEFGNQINNTPAGEDLNISSGSRLYSFAVLKDCDDFYGFGTSDNNDDVIRFDFGSSVDNIPIQTTLSLNGVGGAVLNQPVGLEVFYQNSEFQIFIGSFSLKLFRINIGSSVTSNTVDLYEVPSYTTENIQYSIDFIRNNSQYVGFGVNTTGLLKKVILNESCPASIDYTLSDTDVEVSYNAPGTYPIQLESFSLEGTRDIFSKSVTVTSNVAPSISYTSQNICLSSPVQFTSESQSSGLVYSWDFGDATTSTEENPSHTYAAAGVYEVTLEVSNGTCGNFTRQTITVYDEPVPTFSAPGGLICTNQMLNITNTTLGDFGDNETWEWQIDGSTVSSERDLEFTFPTGGMKEIKLIASIPGCSAELIQNINVEEGPSPAFVAENVCVGTLMQFNNASIGQIDT